MDVNPYKPYSTLRFRQVVSIQSNDICIQLQLFLTSVHSGQSVEFFATIPIKRACNHLYTVV